jgi:Patatin-like phospholipase
MASKARGLWCHRIDRIAVWLFAMPPKGRSALGARQAVGDTAEETAMIWRELEKPVAFVLGGGGSLGAMQVGMLEALAERAIVPDFVVGTSVGAINGAILAADRGRFCGPVAWHVGTLGPGVGGSEPST